MSIEEIEKKILKKVRRDARTWKAWEFLKQGYHLTSLEFFKATGDMNLRNKISILRKAGAPISSRRVGGKSKGFYKEYFLDLESQDD